MSLRTIIVDQKETWEAFVQSREEANFLQSWNWGEFHRQLDKNVYPLHILEDDIPVAAALVVAEKAKRGNYLTIAGGPLLSWNSVNRTQQWDALAEKLHEIGKQENAVFTRLRPQELATPELSIFLESKGLSLAPMHLTADLTLQLDLTASEEQLLLNMRKNTRGEVRKAQKLGITVTESTDPAKIKEFYEQQLAVAQRQGFIPFSYEFLYQQFLAFAADNQVRLFQAWQENTLLASAFVILYNGEAVYHYGISTPENARLPGSYACQWHAILFAKAAGMKRYNFWGVSPLDEPNHRFAGVGLFKRGFGGQEVQYQPAYDLPLSWMYSLTRLFELGRKKMRKL